MRAAAVAIALLIVLSACGSSLPAGALTSPGGGAVQHGKITVAGVDRTYRIFLPASVDRQHPRPLVVLLHGCGGSGDEFASLTRFDDVAARTASVAVYPDAVNELPGLGHCWNEFLDPAQKDDLGFISQLLDRLTADLAVDRTRIFVTGLQSGGHMAYTLACAMPQRLAGMASVSGGMPVDSRKDAMRCTGATAISVLEMHGTADDFIPYDGGGPLDAPPIPELARYWAGVDGCAGDPAITQSGITTTSTWTRCRDATVVRLDKVTGGHNTWFGSNGQAVAAEPDASAAVWAFFSSLAPRT